VRPGHDRRARNRDLNRERWRDAGVLAFWVAQALILIAVLRLLAAGYPDVAGLLAGITGTILLLAWLPPLKRRLR
jgi:hypothetical protein